MVQEWFHELEKLACEYRLYPPGHESVYLRQDNEKRRAELWKKIRKRRVELTSMR